jgi:hypothetical protein
MAVKDCLAPAADPPCKHPLRPINILKLSEQSQAYINHLIVRPAEACASQSDRPSKDSSIPNETNPRNYIIPQKRAMQMESVQEPSRTHTQRIQHRWDSAFKTRVSKEKVIGGLTKEDELRSMWIKFDEQERRERFRPARGFEDRPLSGNEVLGAWEEECMLYDLERDEGPW